jgi:hypothetical protein
MDNVHSKYQAFLKEMMDGLKAQLNLAQGNALGRLLSPARRPVRPA